ncbi:acyltransferase family protein [Nocardia stercoris]|uniref:Acyltransferase n=1 Tax=Nocardia stercoris TaxID=2483361 RepID=A0A3M2LC40_9NOCA|nr:acyltransferase family protein [Nocardia stercoris]RMI34143.1 acyltransferase [Nocardia stercoris]
MFATSPALPSPAAVAAGTSSERDRAIDVARLVSLLVVMFGHCAMLLATITAGGVRIGDTLQSAPALQPLTWVLQIMPLFFLAGGAAAAYGLRAETPWGTWLVGKAQRLCRPVFWYLAVWTVALGAVRVGMGAASAAQLGEQVVSLLWFLGVYLMVLACVPALTQLDTAPRLWLGIAALLGAAGSADVSRIASGSDLFGYPSFLTVWLIPTLIGIGYARKLIAPRTAVVAALTALAAEIALVAFGPYQVSLVVTGSAGISNVSPPTVVLALHCVAMSLFFVAAAGRVERWARHPKVWYPVAVGNAGAMTLYLWHIPAIAVAAFGLHLADLDAHDPHQPGFWFRIALRACAFAAVLALLFPLLTRFEQRPLPWWDARLPRTTAARSTVAGLFVCLAGASILLAAKQGLGTELGWFAAVGFVGLCASARHAAGAVREL